MTRPRRYVPPRLPDAEPGPETVVRQVFWRLGDGWVLRLRRAGPAGAPSEDTLAVRGPGGVEWALDPGPEPAVAALFRAGAAHRVLALRRRYRVAGAEWDVDEYHWENEGLLLARPVTAAPAPPGWRDVTADPAYDEDALAYAPFTGWAARSR